MPQVIDLVVAPAALFDANADMSRLMLADTAIFAGGTV